MLEKLAEATHDVFCEGLENREYKYGPKTDETLKTHIALRPYAELPKEMKEQNRRNVRDIPVKLAAASYIMIPARSSDRPFSFPGEGLEQLAKAEHERWMQAMLDDSWTYASETDRAKKQHKLLIPWDELPEEEKEKDRDLVRGIPTILARAGYTVVKSSE